MPVPAANMANDRAHVEALTQLTSQQQWAIKYLYDRLGIIDNKTSGLLRFNAVVMGFLAVLATRFNDLGAKAPKTLLSAACVTFVLLALAEYQAFRIFYLVTTHPLRRFDSSIAR
jgi:hypothetical protein